MKKDMSVPCGEGLINLRVGAIIMKKGKILMAGNNIFPGYLYTVGGRLKFGETAEEAVVREVFEETGRKLEIDRLGFVQENYFYGDAGVHKGKLIYEIAYFFYMKVPEDFEPVSEKFMEGEHEEFLRWIDIDDPMPYFPEFFRTELLQPVDTVKYFLTDGR
ncbi:MAG: NUDIX domain-containing protein [Lachnospiraceae bacterium]|nr:NUDIX domain-containing protein [Lachnospiraceae bacterium]